MASDFRCLLLSPENAPFDEYIFSIKFCEIFQGFIKKFQGFSRVSRDFQGFKNFPGFSRISRVHTTLLILPYFPVYKSNLCVSQPLFFSQNKASFRIFVYKSTSVFCKTKILKLCKSSKLVTKNHASNTKKTATHKYNK